MPNEFLNKTGLTYFYGRLKTIFAKVSDVEALATKVNDIISEGGEPNAIATIKVNGEALPILDKAVEISVPTKLSALNNDSGFQTSGEVQDAIDAALDDVSGIDFRVVDNLPAQGEKGVIYLVHGSATSTNSYAEYIWISPAAGDPHFEKIGTTDVDLSGYWRLTDLAAITTEEIDAIVV